MLLRPIHHHHHHVTTDDDGWMDVTWYYIWQKKKRVPAFFIPAHLRLLHIHMKWNHPPLLQYLPSTGFFSLLHFICCLSYNNEILVLRKQPFSSLYYHPLTPMYTADGSVCLWCPYLSPILHVGCIDKQLRFHSFLFYRFISCCSQHSHSSHHQHDGGDIIPPKQQTTFFFSSPYCYVLLHNIKVKPLLQNWKKENICSYLINFYYQLQLHIWFFFKHYFFSS